MVESHRFNPVERLQWRNSRLDFSSLHALRHSLKRRPRQEHLVLARDADDVQAFDVMTNNPEILDRLQHPEAIHHLWDVCRVPDFRQTMPDAHHRLQQQLFLQLTGADGVVAEDWLAPQIEALDRPDGDMDALSHRLAHMRTWTYVANRANWLRDPGHWRERTRALEDRLSDALHAALTQRFVDRRTATLYRSLKSKSQLFGAVTADGDVLVEGQFVGKLQGLTFIPDAAADLADGRAIRTAANRVLLRELDKIAAQLVDAPDGEISWRDDNRLWWRGARVAKLAPSGNLRRPRLEILETDHLSGSWREQVRRRLLSWLESEIDRQLAPLIGLEKLSLSAPGRGLVFQLAEGLGQTSRTQLEASITTLSKGEKRQLTRAGVHFGYVDIYMPALLRPERVQLKARLWSAKQADKADWLPPRPGLVSIDREAGQNDAFYAICGFRGFRSFVMRMDMVDRLAGLAHHAAMKGPFALDHTMMSLAGRSAEDLDQLLKSLGYRGKQIDNVLKYRFKGKKIPVAKISKTETGNVMTGPFAELKNLKVRRH
jgi:ATP-dependent RNA helicase SUPV3L1/SUV3